VPEGAVDHLIAHPGVFTFDREGDARFRAAMAENFDHHYHNCPLYRQLCDREGFTPAQLDSGGDLFAIPRIFVDVFKSRQLLSIDPAQVSLVLTSSGTGGHKSAMYLDDITLSRIRAIVHGIYNAYGMKNPTTPTNYLCFTYDTAHAADVGTAFSDDLLSSLTPLKRVVYALTWREDSGTFELDREACQRALEEFAEDRAPLRILGFPSFAHDVLGRYCGSGGRAFSFGSDSFVITGGGWKTLGGKEIPRPQFKQDLGRWLGIPPQNVRDLYGLVEHGVPYCECESGNLHVPQYSRALARDPATLEALPPGQTGLLHLYTPYLNSVPGLSLLTSDLGRVETGCACGRNAPFLVLEGRAGVRKHKGCAITALEILQRAADGE